MNKLFFFHFKFDYFSMNVPEYHLVTESFPMVLVRYTFLGNINVKLLMNLKFVHVNFELVQFQQTISHIIQLK